MNKQLRILLVEDAPADADLNERELRKGGIAFLSRRVDTREGFLKELEEFMPDLILSDHSLPQFDSLAALTIAKEKCPDVPFILVSGSIGEELAIEMLKRGMTDYVLKTNLRRLVPAVKRALQEAGERAERRNALKQVQKEIDLNQTLIQASPAFIVAIGSDGKTLLMNKSMLDALGYTADEVTGKDYIPNFVSESDKTLLSDVFSRIREMKESTVNENLILTKDRRELLVEWHGRPILDAQGNFDYFLGVGLDITERKRAELALKASEAELHDAYFSEATINMILNESLHDQPLEEFLQKSLNMILSVPWIELQPIGSISIVEDEKDVLVMKAQSNIPEPLRKLCERVPFGKCLSGKAAQSQEIQFADHVDERHEICCDEVPPHGHYAVPIVFGGRTLGVLNLYPNERQTRKKKEEEEFLNAIADTMAGIIKRKKAEYWIEYLAYYDALTGLPNRNLFIDRLAQGIGRAEYEKKLVAVMTVDIDRFKTINDTYGLDAGDAVLKEIAKRLLSSVREGDTIARLGNDDFGVLLIDVADSADIILVIDKIIRNASRPMQFDDKEIILTLSSGISVYPNDGKDASSLIKNADLAFARAKQQGRKNYQFYTQDMDEKAIEFVQIERNLFNAMRNEEFVLHYQPYWDINTKEILGIEALIRWRSPELGLVSPAKFIPVLEDTGMIIEVGEWILRTAIRQIKEWQNKGYSVVPVSVNLSLVQFRDKQLAEMVKRIIRENGFYPSLLTLEITESAFMQDVEFTASVLKSLRNIGVSISVDDFGTGYSSLAYLKKFPIDNLKIDISFVREIVKDPDSASIIMAIINMAHTLQLKTIAEGIETEEQWKFLRLLRCDMGQGFYFSKPLPAEEVEKLFKQQ